MTINQPIKNKFTWSKKYFIGTLRKIQGWVYL